MPFPQPYEPPAYLSGVVPRRRAANVAGAADGQQALMEGVADGGGAQPPVAPAPVQQQPPPPPSGTPRMGVEPPARTPDPADLAAARYLAPGPTDAPAWKPPVEPVPPNPNPVDYRRPSERSRDEYNELTRAPVEDENGRLRSAILNAFHYMARNADAATQRALSGGRPVDMYDVGGILGGGAGGAFAGGVNPRVDEHRRRERSKQELAALIGQQLKIEQSEQDYYNLLSQMEHRDAQTDYIRNTKPQEAAARLLGQRQRFALQQLRVLKGSKIDPNNPAHKKVLDDLAAVGFVVDPESLNNSSGNLIRGYQIDPANPSQRRAVLINKVTEEVTDLGLVDNYTTPRDTEGWTSHQRATFGLSQDRFDEMVRMNDVRSEQIRTSIEKTRAELAGVSAADVRRFNIDVKGLNERLGRVERERLQWEKWAKEGRVSPQSRDEKVGELDAEAKAIRAEFEAARARATSGAGRRPAPPGGGRPAPGSKGRVSRRSFDQVRARNPGLKGKSDAEVEAALRAEGYEVY